MTHINWVRVLLGGLVWCVSYNLLTGATWYVFLRSVGLVSFHPVLGNPETPFNVYFLLLTLAMGIFAAWFYAAIRPRYGAGPVTAAYAGVALWLVWNLFPLTPDAMRSLPTGPLVLELVSKLAVIVLSTLSAGWLYREAGPAGAPAAPVA